MNIIKKILSFYLLITFIPCAYNSFSQGHSKGIIINEVYFDKAKPVNNWIEIYNPTNQSLTLERFRLSHVRSLNVLPAGIRKRGGLIIHPNEYYIICANKNQFKSLWGNQKNVLEIPLLSFLSDGGYVVLFTGEFKDTGIDAFRYGKAERTQRYSFFTNQVLELSNDGKSYSRELTVDSGNIITGNFINSSPTPGKPNK